MSLTGRCSVVVDSAIQACRCVVRDNIWEQSGWKIWNMSSGLRPVDYENLHNKIGGLHLRGRVAYGPRDSAPA